MSSLIAAKYVREKYPDIKKVFCVGLKSLRTMLESVGIEAHTGFTLSTKEQNEWRAHSEVCKIKHNMSDHRVFAPVSRQHGVSDSGAHR